MSENAKRRNSNLEVLRILAIFIIVMSHYSYAGLGLGLPYSLNRYFAAYMFSSGEFGVMIFLMISGYYMCTQKFTLRKLLRLVGETWFYSVVFYVIFALANRGGAHAALAELGLDFGLTATIQAFLPIGYGRNWFITSYVVLMMLSPLLNVILQHLDRRTLRDSLAVATIVWSVVYVFTEVHYEYARIMWLCVVYLYAGYVRLYGNTDGSARRSIIIAIISQGMVYASATAIILVGRVTGITALYDHASHFSGINSPFVLFAAMSLMLAALRMRSFYSRAVNVIASTTLGVYLIHCNYYVTEYLWKEIVGLPESSYGYWWMPFHAIAVSLVVLLACAAIDLLRQVTLERLWVQLIDRCMPWLEDGCDRVLNAAGRLLDSVVASK